MRHPRHQDNTETHATRDQPKRLRTTRIWQVYCDILKIGGSLLEFAHHKFSEDALSRAREVLCQAVLA